MRLYIAGPMTGLPGSNYAAFNAAELELREQGYAPINPARRGHVDGWGWLDYMRPAIRDVSECEGVATLPGWQRSRGASIEVHLARRLGLPVNPVHVWGFFLDPDHSQHRYKETPAS